MREPDHAPLNTAAIRWPSPAARQWGELAFAQLCSNECVLAVVLLGSAVRPVEASFDLDCLFIYRDHRPLFLAAPMDVDIRGYGAEQVEDLVAAGHDLLVWAVRYGEVVCQRDQYWSQLTDRWRERLPLPSPEAADARAEAAERMRAEMEDAGDEDAAAEQQLAAATQRARAALIRSGVFPASRPELPAQLRAMGQLQLAEALIGAIDQRNRLAETPIGGQSRHHGAA